MDEKRGIAVMVCEEDHIRIQSIKAGANLEEALSDVFETDRMISEKLNIAFDEKYGYNFKNYERYKYGGSMIGNTNLNYAIFDLEQFVKLPKVKPTDEDKRIFAKILSCVECLESSDKVGRLREVIRKAKIFKTNKDEISVLLGELGICGILASNDFPAYDVYFANEYERDPVEYKNDFAYPVNRWYARDGINCKRLIEVFGEPFCDYK